MTDSNPNDAASGVEAAPLNPSYGDTESLFVVGLGASAGGLKALEAFFASVPLDSGLGYVVITHQPLGQLSLLPELIAKHTALQVVRAEDGTAVVPDTVFLPAPGTHMEIRQGVLRLLDPPEAAGKRFAIDSFFRSLAADLGHRAIGIVLSGTGTDGTEGIRAIKGEAGLALAQDERSAEFGSMPRSACATGLVDFVLAPEDMPDRLTRHSKWIRKAAPSPSGLTFPPPVYDRVLLLLRRRAGHDFRHYKKKTIFRRLERRLLLHDLQNLPDYLTLIKDDPAELDALFQELLIGVTSFFREPEAFAALATGLDELLKDRPDGYQVRVWVAGCSTGEEPYSVAITLRESFERLKRPFALQVFATDINPQAIEAARRGRYASGIAANVTPERLSRWFKEVDDGYQIAESLRENVIFAPQDVLADPPFTKLDLITCRNLLIYLQSDRQRQLLPMFHYALKPGGILLLGSSETASDVEDLLDPIDKKWKLFRRRADSHPRLPNLSLRHRAERETEQVEASANVSDLADRLLLEAHCPPSVVVSHLGEILHIRGRTGFCLEPAQGRPKLNLINMAREGLAPDLAAALRTASSQRVSVSRRVRVKSDSAWCSVDLEVTPIEQRGLQGTLLVTFRRVPSAPGDAQLEPLAEAAHSEGSDPLELELARTRQNLQAAVEEVEASNEDLKSTNEELQSTNEELQSTNEELETSKEELQSLNEELQTVNAELQEKLGDLSRANDDMTNLLNSTDVATVFLDNELRIKRFTPQAKGIFQLIDSDVGRPITDLASQLKYLEFESDAKEVTRTLIPKKLELRTEGGAYYLTRIMPYRTSDNRLDGLVITFVDTTLVQGARSLAMRLTELVDVPLMILSGDLAVTSANKALCQLFGLILDQTIGKTIHELWVGAQLREALQRLEAAGELRAYRFRTTLPQDGPVSLLLNAQRLENPSQFVISFSLDDGSSESAPRG